MFIRKKQKTGVLGQIALILIFLLVLLFIFFPIILNLGKVAQSKAQVTIAANTGAALMASEMAGISEYMYQTALGGGGSKKNADTDLTVCKWSSFFADLLAIIIVVALIILAAVTGQIYFIGFLTHMLISLVAGGIMTAMVEPGQVASINSKMDRMSPADQFLERGIYMAAVTAISDNKQIYDRVDSDQDGFWEDNLNGDKVNRFGYYYNNFRLGNIAQPTTDERIVREFQNALGEFLYEHYLYNPHYYTGGPCSHQDCIANPGCCTNYDSDDWGLWDPVWNTCSSTTPNGCCDEKNPSFPECNACCLPNGKDTSGVANGEPDVRPSCCDDIDPDNNCGSVAPGGGAGPGTCRSNGFPWAFDSLYEVKQDPNLFSTTGFTSLRERLGHDDDNRLLTYTAFSPRTPIFDPSPPIWRQNDSWGQLYPLLWDLSKVAAANPSNSNNPTCYWCDPKAAPLGLTNEYGQPCGANDWGLVGPKALPTCDKGILGAAGCCLTSAAGTTDRVTNLKSKILPTPGKDAVLSPLECYDEGNLDNGWWKKGADKNCARLYPYDNSCPGQYCFDGTSIYPAAPSGNPPCSTCNDPPETACSPPYCTALPPDYTPGYCPQLAYPLALDGGGNPDPDFNGCAIAPAGGYQTYWNNDSVDTVRYGLDEFLSWADDVLKTDPVQLANNFEAWYPTADQWLHIPDSGIPGDKPGKLHLWANTYMNKWHTDLSTWLNYDQYLGANPGDKCFPSGGPTQVWINDTSHPLQSVIPCLNSAITTEQAAKVILDNCYNKCKASCTNPDPCLGGTCSGATCVAADCPVAPPFAPANPAYVCTIGKLAIDSANNILKYQARRDFLTGLSNQVDPATIGTMTNELQTAKDKFNNFLNDPAVVAMRDEYWRLHNITSNPVVPPYVIYGWKTDAPGRTRGYWHVVMVEGQLPGRCNDTCGRMSPIWEGWGAGQPWNEPAWPYLKFYQRLAGTRDCTTLGDSFDRFPDGTPNPQCDTTGDYAHNPRECFRGGTVKAKVIRYDEDKDTSLKLSNNLFLWRFLYSRSGSEDPHQLDLHCDDPMVAHGIDPEAFILKDKSDSNACWVHASKLLERGIMSKSCAEYFFHQAPGRSKLNGFNIKFVNCDPRYF